AVVDIVIPALRVLLSLLDQVARAINFAFGTDFTGTSLAAALVITRLTGLFGLLRSSINIVIGAVRLLAVAFGGVTVAIAAVGFAIGFFAVRAIQQIGGLQGVWNAFWQGVGTIATTALNGV